MPTADDVATLRTINEDVRELAARDARALWQRYDASTADRELTELLMALVERYGNVTAMASAEWYADLRERADPRRRPWTPDLAPLPEVGEVASVGAWARKALEADDLDGALSRLERGAGRLVLAPGNDTIVRAPDADPWPPRVSRVARATACTFCRMLTLNEDFYRPTRGGFAAHDGCHCVAAPAWGDDDSPAADFDTTDDAYDAAVRAGNTTTTDILAHMRAELGTK